MVLMYYLEQSCRTRIAALVGVPTPMVETVAALVDMKTRQRGNGPALQAA